MKKLTLILLTLISLLLLHACSSTGMMETHLDPRLPKLNGVKSIPDTTSVAFEWKSMAEKGITGYSIYRTKRNHYVDSPNKELPRVAMISNPFATHYVDKGLKQNSQYTYTFTTLKGSFESPNGQVLSVKTLPLIPAVTFFQVFRKTPTVIKLIWRPHPDKRIKMYKIERSTNGGKWTWLASVKGRMMAEYVDDYVAPPNQYWYRVIAVGFDDTLSQSTKPIHIFAR